MEGRRCRLGGDPDATHLLILFDGREWIRMPLLSVLRKMSDDGALPPLRVAAIDTGVEEERLATLGRSADFRRWLSRSFLPAMQWTDRPERTIVCGQSLGGLAAVDVASGPERIADYVLSNSGAFAFPRWGVQDGGVTAEVLGSDEVGRRLLERGVTLHFSVGLAEPVMIPQTQAVVDVLQDAGVPASLEISRHGHDWAGWTGALVRGLVRLLGA